MLKRFWPSMVYLFTGNKREIVDDVVEVSYGICHQALDELEKNEIENVKETLKFHLFDIRRRFGPNVGSTFVAFYDKVSQLREQKKDQDSQT